MGERQNRISIRRRDGEGVMEEVEELGWRCGVKKGRGRSGRGEGDKTAHQSGEEPPSMKCMCGTFPQREPHKTGVVFSFSSS